MYGYRTPFLALASKFFAEKNFLYFSWKNPLQKTLLYFGKWYFLSPSLKCSHIMSEKRLFLYFQEGTWKSWKTKISIISRWLMIKLLVFLIFFRWNFFITVIRIFRIIRPNDIFLKTLSDNSFHLFYKQNQTISLALILIFYRNISFVLNVFLAILNVFLLYISSILFFFIILLTFSQISIYLSKTFSSFIIKHIRSASSKSILYALTFE